MNENIERHDLRISKTNEKLRDALGSLMEERPYDDITVIDICERANVRRATFYRHFSDKHDFLIHTITAIADDMSHAAHEKYGNSGLCEYIIGYVKEVFAFIQEKNRPFDNVLSSTAIYRVYEISLKTTQKLLMGNFDDADVNGTLAAGTKIAASAFINGGISHMVINFFLSKDNRVEEFFAELRRILEKLFSE